MSRLTVLALCLLIGCATPATVYINRNFDTTKIRRVGVVSFECSQREDVGKTAADIAAAELGALDMFDLVERNQMDRVIEEHQLTARKLFDPKTVKQKGRLLGVDGLLLGSVRLDYRYISILFGPVPIEELKGVTVNIRLVDVQTGAVIWEGTQSSKNVVFAYPPPTTVSDHIRVAVKSIFKELRKKLSKPKGEQ